MEIKKFNVGDVLEMKKKHPCGENRMRVMRIGSDIRIEAIRRLGYHLEVDKL